MEKIKALGSEDIVANNIVKLKELFPTIFSEGKLVVEELQALVGEYIEENKEFYQMTWAGKTEAKKEANKVSTGTLRPIRTDSKDWDTTGNIFIEGDNLEVLKLLQKTYSNKIKMIYIDPPYNTGKDFVYKDNYKDNLHNYLELTGQTDEEGKKTTTNTDSDGRYHSNWLNMMYPRLKLARNLMTDDGVIFISIDDNEQANLKKLCDEIFGEENFIAQLIWEQGKKSTSNLISINHEYILVYSKSGLNNLELNFFRYKREGLDNIYKKEIELRKIYSSDFNSIRKELIKYYNNLSDSEPLKKIKHYNWVDEKGIYFPDNVSAPDKPETRSHLALTHPITNKKCKVPSKGWRYKEETIYKLLENNEIHFGEDENSVPCFKRYLKDNEFESMPSVFYKDGRGASNRLKELFNEKKVFDFPKDEEVLKRIINSNNDKSIIILDFFAGSGTTAHAVMALNAEDGGNRKCISVQLPEPTDEKSEAYKAGYKTIAEITKERIRRAGELVKQEYKDKEGIEKLDVGFRAFKLDSSNIQAWDTAVDQFEDQLDLFLENNGDSIKSDRTEEDVLFEILLKYGLDLTLPIQEKQVDGCMIYNIGFGAMYICLSDCINISVAVAIGEWHKDSSDTKPSVIFKDAGFANDADKTNTVQTLRQAGIENVKSI